MIWNIYDEDKNEFIVRELHSSLDEAVDMLIEAYHKEENYNSREWGIFLYPLDKEAVVEIMEVEHTFCLVAGRNF